MDNKTLKALLFLLLVLILSISFSKCSMKENAPGQLKDNTNINSKEFVVKMNLTK